jgi:hypothetical protein
MAIEGHHELLVVIVNQTEPLSIIPESDKGGDGGRCRDGEKAIEGQADRSAGASRSAIVGEMETTKMTRSRLVGQLIRVEECMWARECG